MEDKIFDIVTDLIRGDVGKEEAISQLLGLLNVSDIPCQHKNTIGINQKYDRCKDCGKYLEDYY